MKLILILISLLLIGCSPEQIDVEQPITKVDTTDVIPTSGVPIEFDVTINNWK